MPWPGPGAPGGFWPEKQVPRWWLHSPAMLMAGLSPACVRPVPCSQKPQGAPGLQALQPTRGHVSRTWLSSLRPQSEWVPLTGEWGKRGMKQPEYQWQARAVT